MAKEELVGFGGARLIACKTQGGLKAAARIVDVLTESKECLMLPSGQVDRWHLYFPSSTEGLIHGRPELAGAVGLGDVTAESDGGYAIIWLPPRVPGAAPRTETDIHRSKTTPEAFGPKLPTCQCQYGTDAEGVFRHKERCPLSDP